MWSEDPRLNPKDPSLTWEAPDAKTLPPGSQDKSQSLFRGDKLLRKGKKMRGENALYDKLSLYFKEGQFLRVRGAYFGRRPGK